MIDANLLVRTWLLLPSLIIDGVLVVNQVPILLNELFTPGGAYPNNTPNRIYAGHLVPGFDPQYGPGIVVRVGSGTSTGTSGGSAHPEMPVISPRMQITCWASVNQYDVARQIYRAAYDWMQRRNNINLGDDVGYVLSSLEQVEGQDYDDPHTGLAAVISFWKLMLLED